MVLHSSHFCSIVRCLLHPHDTANSFRPLRCISKSVVNMRQSLQTHYEVLGLLPSASQMEIRSAFLQLSKQLHPDLNPSDPKNHTNFVQLNEAYSVLSNISSRREYDFRLQHSKRFHATAPSYATNSSRSPPQSRHRATGQQQSNREDWDWDEDYETEFEGHRRARNAEAVYSDDAYYGIKGIRRQSNAVVAATISCVLLLLGSVYFYLGFKYALRKSELYLKMDRENLRVLREVEERARKHSFEEQLQRLRKRSEASEIGPKLDATKSQC